MLTARFAKSCLKNERTKNMFSRNTKRYPMTLSKTKKYKEAKQNTNRLQKSAIMCMERLMNKQQQKKQKTKTICAK